MPPHLKSQKSLYKIEKPNEFSDCRMDALVISILQTDIFINRKIRFSLDLSEINPKVHLSFGNAQLILNYTNQKIHFYSV